MSTEKVLSYGALIAQNAYLKKELSKENMRKQYLIEETKVQARVIGQLKSLMKNQTKFKYICSRGHPMCRIDHETYSYVKPPIRTDRSFTKVSSMEVKLHRQKENSFQAKVVKTVDRLQSKYGVPPSSRENSAEDLIVSEFASIWDNILSFQHNVLKVDGDKKLTTSSADEN